MNPLSKCYVVAGVGKMEAAITIKHRVITADEALRQTWAGDFYLTQYRVERAGVNIAKVPRLRKEHAAKLSERGFQVRCDVRIADLDTKPKRPLILQERIRIARALTQYGCCYYFTTNGVRVIQPLTRALTPDELEVCLGRWLAILDLLVATMNVKGFGVDRGCNDWTRLFRMPRVVRVIEGYPTNLWDTRIYGIACGAVDPGDCSPPPKVIRPKGERQEFFGITPLGRGALARECERVASASDGEGTDTLRSAAFSIGTLVGAGQIDRETAEDQLRLAIAQRGYDPDDYEHTLINCLNHGEANPRAIDAAVDWESHANENGEIGL